LHFTYTRYSVGLQCTIWCNCICRWGK